MAKDEQTAAVATVTPAEVSAMAAQAAADFDWVTVDTGLGSEWDFEHEYSATKPAAGPTMTGVFIGTRAVATKDPQMPGQFRDSTAYLFTTADGLDVFVWGSASIMSAFDKRDDGTYAIDQGDLLRITFLGRETFNGAKGPQQIKRYRVQRAVAKPIAGT